VRVSKRQGARCPLLHASNEKGGTLIDHRKGREGRERKQMIKELGDFRERENWDDLPSRQQQRPGGKKGVVWTGKGLAFQSGT